MGDEVRLKFLYPNGELEIIDCTWIALASLAVPGREPQSQWIVVQYEGREIWKPLGCLIQAELIEGGRGPPVAAQEEPIPALGELGYYR